MLVESAFSAAPAPGPLRAFYKRVKGRRGFQVATVATARQLTVLCWHLVTKGEDYAFARPSLNAHMRRKLELTAGATSRRGPAIGRATCRERVCQYGSISGVAVSQKNKRKIKQIINNKYATD